LKKCFIILLHDLYKRVFLISQRSFGPPDSFCTKCSWNTENGSCYWGPPPICLQPLWETHKRCTWWWKVHSSLLHNKEDHLPDRKEHLPIFFHSRHRWSIPDGSLFPLPLDSSVISFSVTFVVWQKIFCDNYIKY